jgi:hypothetical protein
MDNGDDLEKMIGDLRIKVAALNEKILSLPYGSDERIALEGLQQRMMSDLNKLENDPRRKV